MPCISFCCVLVCLYQSKVPLLTNHSEPQAIKVFPALLGGLGRLLPEIVHLLMHASQQQQVLEGCQR